MSNANLVMVSNLAETSNNVEKKRFGRSGMAGHLVVAVFVGTTLLRSPSSSEIISEYNCASPSYIKYINWEQEKENVGLGVNKAIDLMKIENLNKINKMALFNEDWNGTGGKAFSSAAIILFIEIIKTLEKQPQIAPTGRNSLLLQYELTDKSILAFEVTEKRTEKVYIPKGDYSAAQVEIYNENICQQINESVEYFYGFR